MLSQEALPVTHILLLDDDPFFLRMHTAQLAALGHSSSQCYDNAASALAYLDTTENCRDLILLDVNMPDMDGVEFVRHLGRRKFAGTIALVSGESGRLLNTIERLAIDLGLKMLGNLKKPVALESMAQLMRQWSDLQAVTVAATPSIKYSAGDLGGALARGELLNYYQPQVSLRDGALIGVEALVRWMHPRDGLVPPYRFIGLAENNGMVDDLARCVLAQALRDCGDWEAKGLRPNIAINLSAENLNNTDFSDYIISACRSAGVEPGRVVIEVTESCVIGNQRAALDVLARLGLNRFGLSIDDFGTGYSSLSQLQDIPFTELKIDHRFIHGVAADRTRRAIFEASLGLAQQLQMHCVAEGVEDQDDWAFLRTTECASAQGYFVGRPMPAETLPDWLTQWQSRLEELFN